VALAEEMESDSAPLKSRITLALHRWKTEAGLAGVRDPEALSGLPEDEREGWRSFWAEVDALLKRARGPRP
jgi:hypothetical protein